MRKTEVGFDFGENFRRSFILICELSIITLLCIWWQNYEIYDTFYPSLYVLASFWVCLTTWLIYSLLVHGFFTCDACQSWMNFKTIFWLILVEYIMHLCLSLLMIQLLFSSWAYSLFVSKLYNQKNLPKTLKPSLLYWVFWDCVGLFLHSLETISCTNTLNPTQGSGKEKPFVLMQPFLQYHHQMVSTMLEPPLGGNQ